MRFLGLVFVVGALTASAGCKGGESSTPDGSPLVGEDAGADASVLADASSNSDASPVPDANEVLPDGGAPSDGGSADIAATCSALCGKAESCLGVEDPAECVSECTAELGSMCTPAEIVDLAGCAALDCDGFEPCVYSVPCMGQEEFCGDTVCNEYSEDCASCPEDCGSCVCGDGACSPGECATCIADCPEGCYCGDLCQVSPAHDPSCGNCDEEICAVDPYCCEVEWDGACVGEAESVCGKDCPAFCGDYVCEGEENEDNCPEDCGAVVPPDPDPDEPA